ncbi:MAG TPA: hypothetical protein VHU88_11360 [Sporichthyaceae bacterium]|jgi:hypothetical protein|nr:hypothetical protein [Sporichthyaceae bacterium]
MSWSGVPYVATLRVYEPVEVLAAAGWDWGHWATEPAGDPDDAPALERLAGLRAAIAVPPHPAPASEGGEVLVITVDGAQFGCPWQRRLRCWQALEECRDELPAPTLDACWPPSVVAAAEREFADWRAANPGAAAHIRSSPWEIPLAWMVAFSTGDRRVVRADSAVATREPVVHRLYHLTAMGSARQRIARCLATLTRTIGAGLLVDGIREVGSWLEAFHPKSWVELDHGGLIGLPTDEDLIAVDSIAEISEALAALAGGEMETAVQTYRRLVNRWRSYAQYGHLS